MNLLVGERFGSLDRTGATSESGPIWRWRARTGTTHDREEAEPAILRESVRHRLRHSRDDRRCHVCAILPRWRWSGAGWSLLQRSVWGRSFGLHAYCVWCHGVCVELREEIGVEALAFEEIAVLGEPPPASHGEARYHMFLVTAWGGDARLLDSEHSELRWLSLDHALALPLAHPGYRDLFRAALERANGCNRGI